MCRWDQKCVEIRLNIDKTFILTHSMPSFSVSSEKTKIVPQAAAARVNKGLAYVYKNMNLFMRQLFLRNCFALLKKN